MAGFSQTSLPSLDATTEANARIGRSTMACSAVKPTAMARNAKWIGTAHSANWSSSTGHATGSCSATLGSWIGKRSAKEYSPTAWTTSLSTEKTAQSI